MKINKNRILNSALTILTPASKNVIAIINRGYKKKKEIIIVKYTNKQVIQLMHYLCYHGQLITFKLYKQELFIYINIHKKNWEIDKNKIHLSNLANWKKNQVHNYLKLSTDIIMIREFMQGACNIKINGITN